MVCQRHPVPANATCAPLYTLRARSSRPLTSIVMPDIAAVRLPSSKVVTGSGGGLQ